MPPGCRFSSQFLLLIDLPVEILKHALSSRSTSFVSCPAPGCRAFTVFYIVEWYYEFHFLAGEKVMTPVKKVFFNIGPVNISPGEQSSKLFELSNWHHNRGAIRYNIFVWVFPAKFLPWLRLEKKPSRELGGKNQILFCVLEHCPIVELYFPFNPIVNTGWWILVIRPPLNLITKL